MDEDGFIHRQTVTPGNCHDRQERDTLSLGDVGVLYADAAYSSAGTRGKQAPFGISERVQRKCNRYLFLSEADKYRNAEIALTASVS
tara:strand:- start:52 stop:312 length:261 start_codon:yes stop_codon:yes gene_type:complete